MISKNTMLILLNKAFKRKGGGVTPTGEIDITENGTYDVTDYASANVNVVSENNAKYKTSNLNGTSSNWTYRNIQILPELDFSDKTWTSLSFGNWTGLVELKGLKLSSTMTSMASAFYNNANLVSVPIMNWTNLTDLYTIFYNCSSLSNTSLNNILLSCITAVNCPTKTLAYLGLTQQQAQICETLPAYQDFLTAGWTSGY